MTLTVTDLPTVNACLNALSFFLLTFGYRSIRRRRTHAHRRWMLAALSTSTLFLVSYLIYHQQVGHVPYPYQDWTRPLYFTILIPHVILAVVMVPMVCTAVYHALRGRFRRHRRIARLLLPVWMFVSVSGVAVYLLLYRP
jgi:putative membrane protein